MKRKRGQQKGFKHSEESKRKIGLFWKGKKRGSPSLKARLKKSKAQKGLNLEEKSPLWKGEEAGYWTKHHWVEKRLGKPKKCDHCKSTTKSRYEWANVDHLYRRVLKDYMRLCQSCHAKYDKENKLREGYNHKIPAKITLKGRTKSIVEWCIEKGFHCSSVYRRIHRGMSPKDALTLKFKITHPT